MKRVDYVVGVIKDLESDVGAAWGLVERLEREIDGLHAEIDRLKAIIIRLQSKKK